MATMLWAAKTGVGTKALIAKLKGSAVLKTLKDALRRRFIPKPLLQNGRTTLARAQEKCLKKSVSRVANLKSNVVRGFVTQASRSRREDRREETGFRIMSLNRPLRSIPMFSLMTITLGMESLIDDNRKQVFSDLKDQFSLYTWKADSLTNPPQSLQDLDMSYETLDTGCEGAVYKARVKDPGALGQASTEQPSTKEGYDLAVKAIFNYGATSNAEIMFREMHREFVPLHLEEVPNNPILASQVGRLPTHPNIVDMPGIFEDDMLVTAEAMEKFPAALPHRLDPERHWGRNKTLYVVMRRRSMHLRDYLATNDVPMTTRCLLLAQLLEAVCHLEHNGVAHRDLKANNILVDIPEDGGPPKLEICDFGCCLANDDRSLKMPYVCRDTNKGGNVWLMAPEIATTTPGPGQVLDYSKADLWAAGAMAYEILGADNPFYPGGACRQLSNQTYTEEDLPSLPEDVPDPLQWLVASMLARDPQERPSPGVAATVAQMVVLEAEKAVKDTKLQLKCPEIVRRAQKERAMLKWVAGHAQALMCQLTVGHSRASAWDVPAVMRFVLLSRLTYSDFRLALAFF